VKTFAKSLDVHGFFKLAPKIKVQTFIIFLFLFFGGHFFSFFRPS